MRLRRGVNPTFIIRAPDGRHMAVALDVTDYVVGEVNRAQVQGATHLLDIEGLWQAAQFIEAMGQREDTTVVGSEKADDTSYD